MTPNLISLLLVWFFFQHQFASQFQIESMLSVSNILSIILLSIFILHFIASRSKISRHWCLIIGLLIALFLVQAFDCNGNEIDLIRFLKTSSNLLVIFLLSAFAMPQFRISQNGSTLLNTYILGAAAIALFAIFQSLGFVSVETSRSFIHYGRIDDPSFIRATGVFCEPAALSGYMIIALFLAVDKKKFIFATLFLIALLLTMSLTAYLGAGAGFFIYLLAREKEKMSGTKIVASISVPLFILCAILGSQSLAGALKLTSDRLANGAFGSYRVSAPIKMFDLYLSHPLNYFSGFGLGSVRTILSSVSLPERADTTHNLFADVIGEMGGAGLVIYFLLFFQIAKHSKLIAGILLVLSFGEIGYRSPSIVMMAVISASLCKQQTHHSRITNV